MALSFKSTRSPEEVTVLKDFWRQSMVESVSLISDKWPKNVGYFWTHDRLFGCFGQDAAEDLEFLGNRKNN